MLYNSLCSGSEIRVWWKWKVNTFQCVFAPIVACLLSLLGFCTFIVCALLLLSQVHASSVQETVGSNSQELVPQERLLPAIAAIIARVVTILGPRVPLFVTCMGASFTLECGQKMLDCAVRGNAPWECIGGLWCSGKSAFNCVKLSGWSSLAIWWIGNKIFPQVEKEKYIKGGDTLVSRTHYFWFWGFIEGGGKR